MPTLTRHLREEHQTILKVLEALDSVKALMLENRPPPSFEFKEILSSLRKLIVDVHHAKEETLLFSALSQLASLPGGPRCTFFMGSRMLQQAEISGRGASSEQGLLRSKKYVSSPLNIPMEEHEIGDRLLFKIETALKKKENGGSDPSGVVNRLGEYTALMHQHIDKEDTCLFIMADHVLSEEVQSVLLSKAHEIDAKAGFTNRNFEDDLLGRIDRLVTSSRVKIKKIENA